MRAPYGPWWGGKVACGDCVVKSERLSVASISYATSRNYVNGSSETLYTQVEGGGPSERPVLCVGHHPL